MTVFTQIPLSGYGGVSRIIVDDLQLSQKDHYWTNVGPVIADQRVIAKVTVHNVGARAAYISAMSFQGRLHHHSSLTDGPIHWRVLCLF